MKNFHTMFFRQNHGFKKTLLITKLSLLLFVTFGFLRISTISAQSPQNKTYTIKCKNQTVESIFEQLEKLSGYNFLYQSSDIKNLKKVTYDFVNAALTDIVTYCLRESGLAFEIVNRQVVIFPASQEKKARVPITVTGKVSNNKGEPLAGTNVVVKGTIQGTTTDQNGNFTIEVQEDAVLIIRFIGYKTKEVPVSARKAISVTMDEEAAELAELAFISTGYQKIRPEQSTGSLASISSRNYNARVNTTNFIDGIQNKIPGLLINNDIEFQSNSLFQIRGIATIYGNKSPLIVIDGFPTDLTMDMINPNDIESVTVLKDAAAATVYGARSSNGVIIIDRVKANIGKPVVTFRSTFSFTPKENYNRYRYDKNPSLTLTEWEKVNSKDISASLWESRKTVESSSFTPTTSIMAHWRSSTDPISLEERDRQLAQLASYNNTEEYSKLFQRTAVSQIYNLDISGGDEFVRYFITANYSNNDLSLVRNNNNSLKLSARTSINLSKKISLDLTTDFFKTNKTTVPVPSIQDIYPYERILDSDGKSLPIFKAFYENYYYYDEQVSKGLQDNKYYPFQELNEVKDETNTLNNRTTVNLRYKFLDGFSLDFGGVYETSQTAFKHLASQNSLEARRTINRYTYGTANNLSYHIPIGGIIKQTNQSVDGYTLRAQLNYNKEFLKGHTLNLILGGELRENLDKSNSSAGFGYDDMTLFHMPVDYKVIESFAGVFYKQQNTISFYDLFQQKYNLDRYVSVYSNIVYSYKGKYSLTGSIRIDQSNLFGTDPKYKYKPLWSAGAAWNIHRESFMEDVECVRSLKLRTAFGFNGNVAKYSIPQVIATSGLNTITPGEITPMLSLLSYANSTLRWERTKNFNSGLDFKIFKNLNGSIDYYVKISTDILAMNQIDATKGGTAAVINNASIRNSGFEINLNSDWISTSRINWNTGIVFSYNTSKVLKVYNTITSNSSSRSYIAGSNADFLEGYAVGAMFALRYAGVDNQGFPLSYDVEGIPKRFFTNDKGIKEIDYVGSSIPVYNTGISNRFDIGNFYLYCMIHYYGGFNIRVNVPTPYAVKRPLKGADKYWKQAGDEANPDLLPFPRSGDVVYMSYTDKFTANGAYLTIGDLTASYSFRNMQFVKELKLKNVEIKLQASNLYTVGFNRYNYSKATRSYEKAYLTPTYTMALNVSF